MSQHEPARPRLGNTVRPPYQNRITSWCQASKSADLIDRDELPGCSKPCAASN